MAAALRTNERFFSRVRSHVSLQKPRAREGFTAHITRVICGKMAAGVHTERCVGLEHAGAVRAAVMGVAWDTCDFLVPISEQLVKLRLLLAFAVVFALCLDGADVHQGR